MSAAIYRTCAELGLTEAEKAALIGVMEMLRSGDLQHIPAARWRAGEIDGLAFNMAEWLEEYGCGTVCCIGGACELFYGVRLMDKAETDAGLSSLLYPRLSGGDFAELTAAQAARAINRYLKTGSVDWTAADDST